jgi:hypothetical protein
MPLRASLLALLLCVAAASAAELKTLKGDVIKGDVVSVDDKEIVIDVPSEGKKTFSLKEIASIDYGPPAKIPADAKFSDVELVDGTLLHCTSFNLNKDNVTLKLLGNEAEVKLPLSAIANILRDGHNPQQRADWNEKTAGSHKRTDDGLILDKANVKGELHVSILSSDEKGNITFKVKETDTESSGPIMSFRGVIFQRTLNPNAPPVACRLTDTGNSNLMVAKVEVKDGALHVLTTANVTVIYKPAQLVKLDYSSANMAYLSDLTPTKVNETSTEERIEHYRKDRNLDDRPMRLLGVVYQKGLALHSTTELVYNIKRDYLTLQGVAGIDDQVGGHDRPVALRIYADDVKAPILDKTFTRKNPQTRVAPFSLNVKGVQTLKIVVTYADGDTFDLGLHLDLADIRVIK